VLRHKILLALRYIVRYSFGYVYKVLQNSSIAYKCHIWQAASQEKSHP
jgi:hypothetical protein